MTRDEETVHLDSLHRLKEREAKAPEATPEHQCTMQRMSARNELCMMIDRLRRKASELEALSRALPVELPPAADEALWNLLQIVKGS